MMYGLTNERLREMIEDLERDCDPENDDVYDALIELYRYREEAEAEAAMEALEETL